jgi:Tol biopolymer transport system component
MIMFKTSLIFLTLALAVLACGTSASQTQPAPAPLSLPDATLPATPAPPLDEPAAVPPASGFTPSVAGLQVAYVSGGNLWMWSETGARQLTFDGRVVAAALSKDGSWLAFLRGAEVWVMRSDGAGEQMLATLPGEAGFPYFAPNGTLLAISTSDHILVLDLNAGSATTVLTYPAIPHFLPQVVWATDSYGFKTIIPVSAEGGAAQLHYAFPDGTVANLGSLDLAPLRESLPLISPDGGYVLYVARHGEDSRSLMLMDASGAARPYGEPAARIRVGGWYPDSKRFTYASEGTGGIAWLTGSVDGPPQAGAPFDPSLGRWVEAGRYLLLENEALSLGDLGGGKWSIASGVQDYAFSSP